VISFVLITIVFKIKKIDGSYSKGHHSVNQNIPYFDIRMFFAQVLIILVLLEFMVVIYLFLHQDILKFESLRYSFIILQLIIFSLFFKIKERVYA